MDSIQARYNRLYSLEEANAKFMKHDPKQLLPTLAPFLKKYDYKYGVCLIHRHCELQDGEIMISTGNVTKPERVTEYYPDRWLVTGEPYEFSDEPSEPPSQDLLEEFRNLIPGVDVLGLFFVREIPEDGYILMETTHGRKNVLNLIKLDDPNPKLAASIDACWLPGHPQRKNHPMEACCSCSHDEGRSGCNCEVGNRDECCGCVQGECPCNPSS
jgi:hypothetical protein